MWGSVQDLCQVRIGQHTVKQGQGGPCPGPAQPRRVCEQLSVAHSETPGWEEGMGMAASGYYLHLEGCGDEFS